jgi:hypothetical protein
LEERLGRVASSVSEAGAHLLPQIICTLKLLLGFSQVISGSLQALDVELNDHIRALLKIITFNSMELFTSENRCSHENTFFYYDELVLYFCFTLFLLGIYSLAAGLVYWVRVVRSPHVTDNGGGWKKDATMDLWNVFFKLILWTALVVFPSLSTK